MLPTPQVDLREYNLDEVFSDLVRDADGRATMTVSGASQRLDVVLGPRYRSVVVWAPNPSGTGRGGQGESPPQERNFICFEPMAAISNALNLAHRGQYGELQTIPPGGTWRESFWADSSMSPSLGAAAACSVGSIRSAVGKLILQPCGFWGACAASGCSGNVPWAGAGQSRQRSSRSISEPG